MKWNSREFSVKRSEIVFISLIFESWTFAFKRYFFLVCLYWPRKWEIRWSHSPHLFSPIYSLPNSWNLHLRRWKTWANPSIVLDFRTSLKFLRFKCVCLFHDNFLTVSSVLLGSPDILKAVRKLRLWPHKGKGIREVETRNTFTLRVRGEHKLSRGKSTEHARPEIKAARKMWVKLGRVWKLGCVGVQGRQKKYGESGKGRTSVRRG